jgi:hypothetical protein
VQPAHDNLETTADRPPRPAEELRMSKTETDPARPASDTGEGDGYAHYANRTEITRAAVEGGLVTALCGFRFAPVRDPQRFPVCPRCKELAGMLGIGG